MNTSHPRNTRLWMVVAITTLAAALNYGAFSDPPQYEVLILDLPDYATGVSPWGINDNAQIVGHYHIGGGDADKPFLWNRGEFIPLELPDGYVQGRCEDINNNGQIVGWIGFYAAPGRGALWDDGQVIDLGTLEGGNFSEAMAINDRCQITGQWGDWSDNDPPIQAFLWEDGQMRSLTPDLPEPESHGRDINEHSQITGDMWTSFETDYRAYIWDAGEVIDLGPIPGGFTSEARAINLHGDVTGRGRMNDYTFHGFLFTDGEMIDLGLVPGATGCRTRDINDSAEIVGYCDEYGHGPGLWAFVWQAGTMYTLNDLLPPELDLELYYAHSINNEGQITANGAVGSDAVIVLLTPINPRPADVNRDGAVDISDLFDVLLDWGGCPDPPQVCPADVNENGTVDLNDIFTLLADWG